MVIEEIEHIHVSCAIIEKDGLVLATQRSECMSLSFCWEFPGGKIKTGENPEECLIREIAEELDVKIEIRTSLKVSMHTYPEFVVTLYPFVCAISSGQLQLNEHAAMTWLKPEKLLGLNWAEADLPVLKAYLRFIGK